MDMKTKQQIFDVLNEGEIISTKLTVLECVEVTSIFDNPKHFKNIVKVKDIWKAIPSDIETLMLDFLEETAMDIQLSYKTIEVYNKKHEVFSQHWNTNTFTRPVAIAKCCCWVFKQL